MGITDTVNAYEDNERELIDRAKAGEAIAFERLAGQHAAPLWRCALALGKDSHWAEDLAQETLIEAWRSLARFDGRCRFSTWLYGILRHRFLKGRRKQNAAGLSASDALGQVPCTSCSPDHFAEASEDARRVRQAVAGLPEEASPGRGTPILCGCDVGRDCLCPWLPVGHGQIAIASCTREIAAEESCGEPFQFLRGITGEQTMNDLRHPCEPWAERISLAAAGCLSPDEERDVRRHIETCPDCRERSRQLSELCGALAEARLPVDDAEAAIVQRVMSAVAAGESGLGPLSRPTFGRCPERLG